MSALPTEDNAAKFPKIDLQVTVMNKTPSQRGGIVLLVPSLCSSTSLAASSEARERHFRRAILLVKHTLWEGGNVLCHCMAGRHRGASGVLVFKAIMEGGDIEVHKVRRQDRNLSAWMEETVQNTHLGSAPPLPSRLLWPPSSLCYTWRRRAAAPSASTRPLLGNCGTRFEPLTSWKLLPGGALRAKDASAWQAPNGSRESELCSPDFPFLHS